MAVDAHWLYRALQNLTSSAIQYAQHQIKLTASLRHIPLFLTIEDDGVGVDAKMAQEIYPLL